MKNKTNTGGPTPTRRGASYVLGKGTQRHVDLKKEADKGRRRYTRYCEGCGCPGHQCECREVKPIHKFNGGAGATICNRCRVVISRGHVDVLFCDDCID